MKITIEKVEGGYVLREDYSGGTGLLGTLVPSKIVFNEDNLRGVFERAEKFFLEEDELCRLMTEEQALAEFAMGKE